MCHKLRNSQLSLASNDLFDYSNEYKIGIVSNEKKNAWNEGINLKFNKILFFTMKFKFYIHSCALT